jgi:hypothetical protein
MSDLDKRLADIADRSGRLTSDDPDVRRLMDDGDDLRGAVEDVLALHAFDPARGEPNSHCDPCRYCQRPWPCPTVAAITARLGVRDA